MPSESFQIIFEAINNPVLSLVIFPPSPKIVEILFKDCGVIEVLLSGEESDGVGEHPESIIRRHNEIIKYRMINKGYKR